MSLAENSAASSSLPVDSTVLDQQYVGRWNQLISTTNWEKGRLIHEWREAMIVAGISASEYSDEAWARRVGGVTGQHVGRLRRVFQQFDGLRDRFPGLFWSHFQAALDWDDAEMWLEGAVQNDWSVVTMRSTRWQTLGGLPGETEPTESAAEAPVDEDYEPLPGTVEAQAAEPGRVDLSSSPVPEGPDFGDEEPGAPFDEGAPSAVEATASESGAITLVRPFEHLGDLPSDLAEAMEAFKLAILRHKAEHWAQVSCEDVLRCLAALQTLAQAPSDG